MPGSRSNLTFKFDDEQLLVSRGNVPSHRIRLWPRPEAELCGTDGFWERFYPEFRIIGYPPRKPKKKVAANQLEFGLGAVENVDTGLALNKTTAYERLRRTLPTAYAMALAPFQSHQWNMLIFLWFHRRFYELIKGNPALAFLLANRREFNWRIYRKEIKLDELTGMKQQKLLELLGLPGTKSMANLLRKIQPASMTPEMLGFLQYIVRQDDILKKLAHIKKINAGVLSLLNTEPRLQAKAAPSLLEEISRSRANNHLPLAVRRLRESAQWQRELRPGQALPTFRTLEELDTFHHGLAEESARLLAQLEAQQAQRAAAARNAEHNRRADEERRREHARKLLHEKFPRPPIAGTEHIQPIETPAGLIEEGNLMHHCVGSYIGSVSAGHMHVYRILAPERATLSISRTPGGHWQVDQLYAAYNRKVGKPTADAVAAWLGDTQLGL